MTCLKGLEVNTNIDGRLPLHYASDYGQLEVIKFLCGKVTDPVPTSLSHHVSLSLLQGAKVNEEDKHGITPLLAAVWEGHTACVKFLLENVREICNAINIHNINISVCQGASRDGKTPDGSSYVEAAEKQEIKDLLTN